MIEFQKRFSPKNDKAETNKITRKFSKLSKFTHSVLTITNSLIFDEKVRVSNY